MKKYYTAIGRFERSGEVNGLSCPIVIINQREYAMDIQEMLLWTLINWRIVDVETLTLLYETRSLETGFITHNSMDNCLRRLLQRGLVAEGSGDTDEQALYDLLSNLYIVPISESLMLKVISFIKLTVFHGISPRHTKKIFAAEKRSEDEKKVMYLSRQALMSTAEIIKCMEQNVLELPHEQTLMDAIYCDEHTTSDNISDMVRLSPYLRPVLLSVSNLYLRKQIIFERI